MPLVQQKCSQSGVNATQRVDAHSSPPATRCVANVVLMLGKRSGLAEKRMGSRPAAYSMTTLDTRGLFLRNTQGGITPSASVQVTRPDTSCSNEGKGVTQSRSWTRPQRLTHRKAANLTSSSVTAVQQEGIIIHAIRPNQGGTLTCKRISCSEWAGGFSSISARACIHKSPG